MLIIKKYIHYFWLYKIQNFNKNKVLQIYIEYLEIFVKNKFLQKQKHNNILSTKNTSLITYNFYYSVKTKHLFLYTLYIIYVKLWKIFQVCSYKFHILKKKNMKLTILRAPCYDKNTKEQYGWSNYRSKITWEMKFTTNKYYHQYVILFYRNMITNNISSKSKLTYKIK